MANETSLSQSFPIYRLYFDDLEEIFLNAISIRSILICSFLLCLLTIGCLIILLYRSNSIFLACFIPCIYALIGYDFVQYLSILLLKYNLWNLNQNSFGEFCRWPYYFKASAEAGQCLTLLLFFVLRRHKLRYFFKHHHLPNSSRIHSRALTLVAFLCIVYVNNWITHLKVEKIHLVTTNEANNEMTIREYPITLYDSTNDWKMKDRRQFYLDLQHYAGRQRANSPGASPSKPEKIIHNQKDDSIHEVIIKIPYTNIYGHNKNGTSASNRTRRKPDRRRTFANRTSTTRNNSYRLHRCTYGQRNFFLANFISLVHAIFYLIFVGAFLSTIFREPIPLMTVAYHRKLCDRALAMGRKRSAERHQQLILLTRLRHFQYVIVYCHTLFALIRLLYFCTGTSILWFVPSAFQCLTMQRLFDVLFLIVFYSIPVRMFVLFVYLFLSLFSSYIYSIFYYLFHTKLHFSCQLRKPSIRFRLHLTPYIQPEIHPDEHSTNSLMIDVTSSVYDEHSTAMPNESIVLMEETSSIQGGLTTQNLSFTLLHPSDSSKTVIP